MKLARSLRLMVILDHDDLYEPVGAAPSTHILKPDHERRDLYPHSAINEWFVMRLAASVGLLVPAVFRRYVPEAVYLVSRFDRVQDAGQWQRLHVVDACQLTGLDRSFKYAEGSLAKLVELLGYCRSAASARTRLYAWLVFNVLVGNNDAHLKNLSFLVDDRGIEQRCLMRVFRWDCRCPRQSGYWIRCCLKLLLKRRGCMRR